MRRFFLTALFVLIAAFASLSAQATEPLDCESPSYLVRIVLGSDDIVGNVFLYETGKSYEKDEIPSIATSIREVKWKKSVTLRGVAGEPPFSVKVKGKSGWIDYRGKREKITCDWFQ